MRRVLVAATLLVALALPAAASAHPSENRNPASTAGGPHCHVNQHSGKTVFLSHKGHLATNAAQGPNAVFVPTTCP